GTDARARIFCGLHSRGQGTLERRCCRSARGPPARSRRGVTEGSGPNHRAVVQSTLQATTINARRPQNSQELWLYGLGAFDVVMPLQCVSKDGSNSRPLLLSGLGVLCVECRER